MIEMIAAAALFAVTTTTPAAPPQETARPAISDRAVNPAQPDFAIIGLPTTLRMPRYASYFRVTHRFTRPLGRGSLRNLVEDFFGFDSSAQIGLELRFGIMAGTQVGVHRTSDRTIQLFAQHQLLRQGEGMPVGVDVIGSVEGTNNFRDSYSPGVGAVVSRTIGRQGAVYLTPIWINNTNSLPSELIDENDTFLLGVGGRVRVLPTVYLVGEIAPRFGYEPGVSYKSAGVEIRAGGHNFQVNFSNGFGTTLSQLAKGGVTNDNWHIGFNIARKFF